MLAFNWQELLQVNPSAIIVGHHMDQEGLDLAERLQNTINNNKYFVIHYKHCYGPIYAM